MRVLLRMRSAALTKCKGELAQALILHRGEVLKAFQVSSRTEACRTRGEIRGPNVPAYLLSCSSKALASFKSAVSKPSVNQP